MALQKSPIEEVMANLIAQGVIPDQQQPQPQPEANPEMWPPAEMPTQPGASPIADAMGAQVPQEAPQAPEVPQAPTPPQDPQMPTGAAPTADTAPSVVSIDPNAALAPDYQAPQPGPGAPQSGLGNSPMAAAMATGGMGGSAPSFGLKNAEGAPAGQLGRPPREAERLGLIGRIRQRPGGSRALLTFGAHLLSGQDFFQSLGQGALAYQNVLDEEAERARPQTTVVGDGAFTQTFDPNTREYSFNETPIAAYQRQAAERKLENARLISEAANGRARDVAQLGVDGRYQVAQLGAETARDVADGRNDTALEVANINARSAAETAGIRAAAAGAGGAAAKPPPASILGQANDHRTTIATANGNITRGQELIAMLDRGDLPLDAINRTRYNMSRTTGIGVNDRVNAYSNLLSFKQQLANAILQMNKGVQTDGDAERAVAELALDGDETTTRAAIARALRVMDRMRRVAHDGIREINDNYPTVGSRNSEGGGSAQQAPARQVPAQRQPQPATSGRTSTGVGWRVVG